MSGPVTTTDGATTASSQPGGWVHAPGQQLRFSNIVRSEWTKLRTVRSTYAAVGAAALLMVGIGALISFGVGRHYHKAGFAEKLVFDPTSVSLASITFAQLAIAVFAILVITSEYSTGMIRTTLQAVPRRGWLLAAKALVFGVVALVVGEVICFAAFFVGQPILKSGPAPYATISQPGVWRAVVLSGVYLLLSGLLAMGVAVLLRHTAGAITVIVAVLFVLPGVANALPTSWQHPVEKYIPTGGGRAMATVMRDPNFLSPLGGLALLCAYCAILLAVALYTLQRRDA